MRPPRWFHSADPEKALEGGVSPRILLIQIAGIGDLLLATPAIDALRERYPEAEIDLLTSARAKPLLTNHPSLNEIHDLDTAALRKPWAVVRWLRARKRVSQLRKNRYHALVSLHNVASSRGAWTLALLMRSLRAPLWVGRNSDGRFPLFDRELRESLTDPVPEPLTKLRVVQRLGAEASPRPLSLPLETAERQRAADLIEKVKMWAALVPGCEDPARRWPQERFETLAKSLAERDYAIVTLGGPGDAGICEAVAQAGGGRSFAGKLSLRETAAVLQRVQVAVSNNTGTMHLAAAMSTPLVALFAPGHAARYRPWMPANRMRLLGEVEGALPGDMSAREMREALGSISIESVLEAVEELANSEPEASTGDGGSGVGERVDLTL